MRTLTLYLLVAFVAGGCDKDPKAIFVIVDGVPPDVLESVPTPNLDAIAGKHGYTKAYVGGTPGTESESPTVSGVSYNSLLTGTWSNKNNVWDNQIGEPDYDYWDIFRIAKSHDASLHTAIFSTWTDNRTKLLGDGLEAAGGYKLDMERFPHDEKADYIRDIDELVTDEAATYIKNNGPDLSWVYLQYTDDVAHFFGDGPEMAAAVQRMDDQIGRIWQAIRHRQLTTNEDWMIVVTTDHGRDAETGKHHGGQTERERTIWIVTNSDNLNAHYYELPAIVDILPSIATHLQLEIPANIRDQLDGQSFVD